LPDPTCWVEGKCIGDLIISEKDVPTKEDCLQLCKDEQACFWVTYHRALSVCMLLSQCNTLDDSDGNTYITAESLCKISQGIFLI